VNEWTGPIERGSSDEDGPRHEAAVVDGSGADEVVQPHGDRPRLLRGDDEPEQEVVPDVGELPDEDDGEAGQRALEAGLDVELPALSAYGAPLRERVERGVVPMELVDRSVRRVLRLKFELGLFEHAYVDADAAAAAFDTSEQRTLARELARQRCVEEGIELRQPRLSLCTDNGAMIAALGAAVVDRGLPPSPLNFATDSSLPVTQVLVDAAS
jgi:hypothetical protein